MLRSICPAMSPGCNPRARKPAAIRSVMASSCPQPTTRCPCTSAGLSGGTAAASAVGPDGQWKEFVLGLLDKGEVLLDDISVVEAPATTAIQMLQNGNFSAGASKWRLLGNHGGTVIDDPDLPGNKVLRLVATGSTDHMSNHVETTLAGNRNATNGRVYRISYRAKWISGSRQLNTRLYFNRLARTTVLDHRPQTGTPGTTNTAWTQNSGPTFTALRHEPAVPAALTPVTVSVSASDPDRVASVTLWSRPDGGSWSSQPMMTRLHRAAGALQIRTET